MLSVAIKKYQHRFIRDLIFQLTKASKDKLLKFKKQRSEELSTSRFENSIIQPSDRGASEYAKTFYRKRPEYDEFNPYILVNSRIIAFVRGWKIRKIMKCQEIINIIKRSTDVSVSIKMSQFNPQTRNFIRDYIVQKRQLVDQFLFTLKKLYHTGMWTKTYRKVPLENPSKTTKYNPNVVVNLSQQVEPRPHMMQSISTITPPLLHLNSISSQILPRIDQHTPLRPQNRDMAWNSPAYRSPQMQYQASPFRPVNFQIIIL